MKNDGANEGGSEPRRTGLPEPADPQSDEPFPGRRAEQALSDREIGQAKQGWKPAEFGEIDLGLACSRRPDVNKLDREDEEDQHDPVKDIGGDERTRPRRLLAARQQVDERVA